MNPLRQTLGIDLGTTNTVIARNFTAMRMSDGRHVTPSAVAFPPSGERLVGRAARRRRAIDPLNTILSAKRVIGARWWSASTTQFRRYYPYELVEMPDGTVGFVTRAGTIDPIAIGTTVIEHVCAEAQIVTSAAHAVVTAPVGFDATRRAATRKAATQVGFSSVGVVEEPVATALAYLNRSNLRYAMVYDLGGGTFDAAVVDCRRYPFRVVAHGGDTFLGGDDVDRAIARYVADRALSRHGWDLQNDAVTFDRLVEACEVAKCALSESEDAAIAIPSVDPAAPESCGVIGITRDEVRKLTLDLVRRSFLICDEVLGEAQLKAREIDAVFLAGGSTKLPGLLEYVQAYFDKRPRFDLDPMHVVSMGASIAAARPAVAQLLDSGL